MTFERIQRARWVLAAVALIPLTSSCISLKTPEKPIEINLNVKIEQEVLVRLQRDVDTLIQQNPDVFPEQPNGGGAR
jgi:hypothetical protein